MIAAVFCYATLFKCGSAFTCVHGQVYCNFHGTVQCYRPVLHIAVMLRSNFFHIITRRSAVCEVVKCSDDEVLFAMVLCYCVTLHVCTRRNVSISCFLFSQVTKPRQSTTSPPKKFFGNIKKNYQLSKASLLLLDKQRGKMAALERVQNLKDFPLNSGQIFEIS